MNSSAHENGSFPKRLHYMLCEIEKDGMESVLSWHPNGLCFVVHSRTAMEEKILPTWFRMSKFQSFQRQLNFYGFHRIKSVPNCKKLIYYHELFVRSDPSLSNNIHRAVKQKSGGKANTLSSSLTIRHSSMDVPREPQPEMERVEARLQGYIMSGRAENGGIERVKDTDAYRRSRPSIPVLRNDATSNPYLGFISSLNYVQQSGLLQLQSPLFTITPTVPSSNFNMQYLPLSNVPLANLWVPGGL